MATKTELFSEIREAFYSTEDQQTRNELLFVGLLAQLPKEDLDEIFPPELRERIKRMEDTCQ
jgi:hypothetical protein